MAKTIILRYSATCADCGAELSAGTTARWYGRGRVYGLGCHTKQVAPGRERSSYERGDNSPGAIASHYDRRGVYNMSGECIGRMRCGCEDYPCCGH